MIECEFWYTPTDAIVWHFDRMPAVGEEVLLGDRGFYRVTGVRTGEPPPVNVAFECEFVRKPTAAELAEMLKRGIHTLP